MIKNATPGRMGLTAYTTVVFVGTGFHVIKWMDHVWMGVLTDTMDRSVLIVNTYLNYYIFLTYFNHLISKSLYLSTVNITKKPIKIIRNLLFPGIKWYKQTIKLITHIRVLRVTVFIYKDDLFDTIWLFNYDAIMSYRFIVNQNTWSKHIWYLVIGIKYDLLHW